MTDKTPSPNSIISNGPVIPLSITPSTDNPLNSEIPSPLNQNHPPIIPPKLPKRVSSRVASGQLRNSRTASLIIPVVTTDIQDNDDTPDIVDLNVNINDDSDNININNNNNNNNNENSPPNSPTLPPRPPKTPQRPSNYEFEPQILEQYGMNRIDVPEFSPVSFKSHKTRNSIDNSSYNPNNDNDNDENDEDENDDDVDVDENDTLVKKNGRYLIQSRKYQVDYVIDILTKSKLTVPNNIFFDKLHSSNSYIEVLSEIRSGSYETANVPILYTLLLNSLKVKEDSFNNNIELDDKSKLKFDNIIDGLSFLLRSTNEQKQQFKIDIMRIYSLFIQTNEVITKNIDNKDNAINFNDDYKEESSNEDIINPNALVAAFVYRCASKNILPQALVIALMIDIFIINSNDNSKEFQFLLLRSFESIDALKLLSKFENNSNPVSYINFLIKSNVFWCNLVHELFKNDATSKNHILGLTTVLNNLVIYGVNSLVEVIINLRHELGIFGYTLEKINDSDEKPFEYINCDLVRFHREFLILNDSAPSQITGYTLEKLSKRNQELEFVLSERRDAYKELLNNYKQLNEEKMSVSGLIEKVKSENDSLQAIKRSLTAQVDSSLGQFEVIKQTMEKNKRVQELNDSLAKEIDRLTKENQKLHK